MPVTPLAGRHVLVIGGTSGIGAAVAAGALARGATVTVAGRDEARARAAADRLGTGATGVAVDVADPAAVTALVEGLDALHDLVVTANEPGGGRVADLDPAAVQRTIGVKLLGQLWAARAAAPRLPADGSITLTAGVASHRPSPGAAVTALINGGVEALVRTLAVELAPVRVNAVSPGIIDTPAWDRLGDDERTAFLARVGGGLPVGRVGRPEEVAEGMLALLLNGFATGVTLPVDGGGRIA